MKLAVVADAHVGNFAAHGGRFEAGLNERCRLTLATLRRAVELANQREAVLVVAGDLFHTKRPEPAVIAAAQRELDRTEQHSPLLMLGNHDAIGPDDDALAPLGPVARVVSESSHYSQYLGVLFVPWSPAPALARLDAALALGGTPTVALLHCGLYDGDMPEYLRGEGAIHVDALRARTVPAGIRVVLAGDYHKHRSWGAGDCVADAVQVGCLNPTGHSDGGTAGYGSVVFADTETGAWERVEVPGPRFLTYHHGKADLAEVAAQVAAGCAVFARLTCAPGDEPAAALEAQAVCEVGARACDVEPVGEDEQPDPAAEPATMDFDDALRECAGKMDLPAGVGVEEVVGRAKEYVRS